MILLDTHVWIWWVNGTKKLPDKIGALINESIEKKEIYISSISVWETAQLLKSGRIEFTLDIETWISKTEALPFVNFVPVSNEIALKSVNLQEPLHQDPADRIIIATAIKLGLKLATFDRKIIKYKHVNTV
ncbi:MAG: type II toxin-antitoxin system VapC family toxin [Thermodesulfobacteriota bacterium]